MHKLTVTLKQHTPLIHFQHDQEGATLRASEVKPKLDKFIVERCFHNNFEECREFLVGYNPDRPDALRDKFNDAERPYRALDYKMRMSGSSSVEEYLFASYLSENKKTSLNNVGISNIVAPSPYFAQEKENGEIKRVADWKAIPKKALIDKENITITIFSVNKLLLSFVLGKIQDFFAKENFGTRQSKGFGCFSVTGIVLNGEVQEIRAFDELVRENFVFAYKKTIVNADLALLFKEITDTYKKIKSGTNRPYFKSLLMEYFRNDENNEDIRWEKKYVKVFSDDIYERTETENYLLKDAHNGHTYDEDDVDETYHYIRACLGLAEQFEFQLENPAEENGKLLIRVVNDDIKRYKSPIQFVVNGNSVYIVGDEINRDILNKDFAFLASIQGDERWVDDEVGKISTPRNFNLSNFVSFAVERGRLGYQKL